MLNDILDLEGVSTLSKKQQKAVNGNGCGFTATFYAPNGDSYTMTVYDDSLSLSDVYDAASGAMVAGADSAHYCCASCGDASWL